MMGRKGTYPAIPATKKPRTARKTTRKQAPLPMPVTLFVSFVNVSTFYQFSNAWKERTGEYFEPKRVPTNTDPKTYSDILVLGVDDCDRVKDLANEITGVRIEDGDVHRAIEMLEGAKESIDCAIRSLRFEIVSFGLTGEHIRDAQSNLSIVLAADFPRMIAAKRAARGVE